MLSWLTTRVRSYGAITLVALYALCVIMPPLASSISSHCPTDDHHGMLRDGIHVHTLGDGAIDKHADTSMNGGDGKLNCHAGACCGLFCCAAITGDSGATAVQPVHVSLLFGALDECLDGRGPQRIGRPQNPSCRFESRRCG